MGVSYANRSGDRGVLAVVAEAVGKPDSGTTGGMQRASTGFKSETGMILPLRQRHRRVFIAMGVMLPIMFAVGLAARKPVPSVAPLTSQAGIRTLGPASKIWDRSDLFAKALVQVRLLRENTQDGRFSLELAATRELVKPDLIVYWVADNTKVIETLPDNALLLGAFNSASLLLPAKVAMENGALVLYSLANNEIVDVSRPIRLTDLSH